MSRKTLPVKIYTLDTETAGLEGELRRIAMYDGETVYMGYTFEEMETILNRDYKDGFNVHVYVHNLDFDARKTEGLFSRTKTKWAQTVAINNKYARITNKTYVLHDSFQLLPESLKSISKSFGVTHEKMDLWQAVEERYPGEYKDIEDYFIRCDPNDPLYLEYLRLDVVSLYEVVMTLQKLCCMELETFVKKMTTASLSRHIFKEGYEGHIFQRPGESQTDYELLTTFSSWGSEKKVRGCDYSYIEVEKKIREAYTGGRTEVFTPRAGRGYYYDVNSLYPSVMIDNHFPIGFPQVFTKPHTVQDRWEKWMKDKKGLGFLKCEVYVPRQYIPPLPTKRGKLAFMTGHLMGIWTFIELEYAVKNCGVKILKYHELIYFEKTSKIFKEFITRFDIMKRQAKKDGKAALEKFAKLIMNTSYGWTAMTREGKTQFSDYRNLTKYQNRLVDANEELGRIEIESIVHAPTIQVQVGAYVTSYARLILLDAMRKQAELGEVYYCDTDSLVCEYPMTPDMVHKTDLGKWDLEHHFERGLFLQPKVYSIQKLKDGVLQTIKKFKGVRKHEQDKFNFDFYEKIHSLLVNGEKGKLTVEEGRKMLSSLKVAQRRNEDPNMVRIIKKDIDLDGTRKRYFDFSKNKSTAWHMESIEHYENFSFRDEYRDFRDENDGLAPMIDNELYEYGDYDGE